MRGGATASIRVCQIALLAAVVCVGPAVASAGAAFCAVYKRSGPNSDDFFEIHHDSTSTGLQAVRSVRKSIKKRMTEEHFSAPYCLHSGELRSGYMVVISIETKYSKGGMRSYYIAGFGKDRQAALEHAFENASRRNWSWVRKRHGYQVQKQFRF